MVEKNCEVLLIFLVYFEVKQTNSLQRLVNFRTTKFNLLIFLWVAIILRLIR